MSMSYGAVLRSCPLRCSAQLRLTVRNAGDVNKRSGSSHLYGMTRLVRNAAMMSSQCSVFSKSIGSTICKVGWLNYNNVLKLKPFPSREMIICRGLRYNQRFNNKGGHGSKSILALKHYWADDPYRQVSSKPDGPVKVKNPRPKGIVPIGEDYGGYNEEKHEEYEKEAEQRQARIQWFKKIFSSMVFLSIFVGVLWARNKKQRTVNENTKNVTFLPRDFLFAGSFNSFCIVESPHGGESCVFQSEIVRDGTLKFIQSMDLRSGDVVVASFPKTGTTWVQEIAYLIENKLDFEKASSNLLEDRFPFLEYPYPGARSIDKMKSPRMIKTHLPFSFLPKHTDNAKIIYVTRNPKDTVVSYYHFARMLSFTGFTGSFAEFLDRFMDGKLPYCSYFSHVESYLQRNNDPNILIVSYEDLSKDPATVIQKISTFLEKPLTSDEVNKIVEHTTFQAMSSNPSVNYKHWDDLGFRKKDEALFMRKGKVGDWRNYFNAESNSQFDNWITSSNKLNIKFEYDP